jgi:hypothetical protein
MDLFSISLTIHELNVLRQSLDVITINGNDAQFIFLLQRNLENSIDEANKQIGSAHTVEEPSSKSKK